MQHRCDAAFLWRPCPCQRPGDRSFFDVLEASASDANTTTVAVASVATVVAVTVATTVVVVVTVSIAETNLGDRLLAKTGVSTIEGVVDTVVAIVDHINIKTASVSSVATSAFSKRPRKNKATIANIQAG